MLVVGLNQTIDRTIRLPALGAGQVLRATDVAVTPGGKAVNVCRAAAHARRPGPARRAVPRPARRGRRRAARRRRAATSPPCRSTASSAARPSIIEADGRTTVINEPGPALERRRVATTSWPRSPRRSATGACRGDQRQRSARRRRRRPPPPDRAGPRARWHRRRRRHRRPADRGGRGRRRPRQPQPRRSRAGARRIGRRLAPIAGGEAVDLDDLDAADVVEPMPGGGRRARRRSAPAPPWCRPVVTASPAGRPTLDVFVPAPAVDVVNPIGAGDALLGATLVALERGRPLEAAVRDGVAYAAASVAHPVAGYADPALVERTRRSCRSAADVPMTADAAATAGRRRSATSPAAPASPRKTVSRALNNEGNVRPDKVARVRRAAAELGFRPNQFARLLRTRGTASMVGVVTASVGDPFWTGVLQGVEAVIGGGDRFILSASTRDRSDRESEIVAAMVERRVMALARRADRGRPVVPRRASSPAARRSCASTGPPSAPTSTPSSPTTSAASGGAWSC